METDTVKQLIEAGIPGAEAHVSGDGCNMETTVIAEAFEGKTPVQKQRLVMATVREQIESNELHAIGIKTFTPAQWAEKSAEG